MDQVSSHSATKSRAGTVEPWLYKRLLGRFPSGVTIVTALDEWGKDWGFTANAFTAVSIDPPLILVCLDNSADCYPVFLTTDRLGVSILGDEQQGVAKAFATKGVDKFGHAELSRDDNGIATIEGSVGQLWCSVDQTIAAGDHIVIVARVEDMAFGEGNAMVYYESTFRKLEVKER